MSKFPFASIKSGIPRRAFLFMPFAFAGLAAVSNRKEHDVPDAAENGSGDLVKVVLFSDAGKREGEVSVHKIVKSAADWRKQLDGDEYAVTRTAGTEPAFANRYWKTHDKGIFRCVCCGTALFRSDEKYDSGTGWPSFWAPIAQQNVRNKTDVSFLMKRVEVLCRKCDAHLGHVFDDGPQPTGLRYCMNSAALVFIPRPV